MRSIREAGCLIQSMAGCGFLVFMVFGCMMVSTLTFRSAMPEAHPPVEIVGNCPAEDVQVFVDGIEGRLESVFDPLGSALEGERPLEEAMDNVDLKDLQTARDLVASTEVPACAATLLTAELELIDDALGILDTLKGCMDESNSDICVPKAMFSASTRLPRHAKRLSEGYEALAKQAGITLPDEIEFGAGEGGLKFQLDQGANGFEIEVP